MVDVWRSATGGFRVVAWLAAGVSVLAAVAHGADEGSRLFTGTLSAGRAAETPYFIRQAPEPGPKVLVLGGMHGNEPAGAEAAGQIRHWPISRGRLVVVPRANPPALEADVRRIPGKPRAEGDLNRNFPATRSDRGVRGPTAEALWEFITVLGPDWILDLHEGYDYHARNPRSVGSSVIHFGRPETDPIVEAMLARVNAEITDEQKLFQGIGRGPVETGAVRATVHHLGAHGVTLETTRADQPMSLRVRQHRLLVHTVLRELGMVEGPALVMLPQRGRVGENGAGEEGAGENGAGGLRVAVYDDAGANSDGVQSVARIVGGMGGDFRFVGGADIRDGALEQFDVVVFPGGRGGAQGESLGDVGRERVREFVGSGGGYVGICAGAYLATCRADSYLKMVRAYHHRPWETGMGRVGIELTEAGRGVLGGDGDGGEIDVVFAHGPLFFHEDGAEPGLDLPGFEVLAVFTRGVEKSGERQEHMEGTPAIVSAPFGNGRVLLISPHPESDEGLSWIVERSLLWASGRGGPAGPEASVHSAGAARGRPRRRCGQARVRTVTR